MGIHRTLKGHTVVQTVFQNLFSQISFQWTNPEKMKLEGSQGLPVDPMNRLQQEVRSLVGMVSADEKIMDLAGIKGKLG